MPLAAPSSLLDPDALIFVRPSGVDLSSAGSLRDLASRLETVAPNLRGSDVLALAGLQAAMLAVASRYSAQEPGALLRARDRAAWERPGELQGFGLGDDASPSSELVAVLIARALAANPALGELRGLLETGSWLELTEGVSAARAWLEAEEPPLHGGASLPALFDAPALVSTDLAEQVAWVAHAWAQWLPESLRIALGRVEGVFAEEQAMRFGGHGGPAPGPGIGAVGDDAPVGFSADRDWMPSCVLIAKQAYVWLHQLSKAYGRAIHRLDQIPDEELDVLADRGFTGLWLIGLWERSSASRDIKQRMGNPEAEASAYSLWDYTIAARLGGDDAWRNLRDRAAERGIRLASDMVPNHVGIDGRWVIEHPEWFVQLSHPPYPGYTFDGPDLCPDPRVGVYLEDGYWNHSDAAVVFKRVDHATGEVRYLYHGNDGTQMPWNDTAQLDYLNPDLREAIIQTILEVARRFPIIRFDAAMTLARRHVQRLWHPMPGTAGAVPSRAEHGVDGDTFAAAMPREFWREVVERVQREVPDTLLLAEAFWMMEGYFVRNLGMHRVYNSAFMHMLRDEDNARFRAMLREVLATSPAVLERFVNFANNPDEDSAADQFGKADKYFGVATLMATLPGLPMFGHGQVEGYTEKYGMEFARAYRDEVPDEGFVAHHERVIFPLLRKRAAFSSAEHFALHDLRGPEGVNENVIAFSNRGAGTRSLVLFNNQWQETAGWLSPGTLPSALSLDVDRWYGLRELHAGVWFLRSGRQLRDEGLFVQLSGYGVQVFADWRELEDHDGAWSRLAAHLAGAGVADLDAASLALEAEEDEGTVEPSEDAEADEQVAGVPEEVVGVLDEIVTAGSAASL